MKIKKNMFTAALFLSSAEDWRKISLFLEDNQFRDINIFALYAFSSELFLKSMLIQSNFELNKLQGSNGHKIDYLFNSLPLNIQEQIKKEIDFEPIKSGVDIETGSRIPGYDSVDEALVLVSNDFTRLRYSCELFNKFEPFFCLH